MPYRSDRRRALPGMTVLTLVLLAPAAPCQVLTGPVTNPANGHAYYLLAPSTWYAAQMQATPSGGNVVTVNDANEQAWVYGTFANHDGQSRNLWTGLVNIDGSFEWADGETSPYRNWADAEPLDPANRRFVKMQGPAGGAPGRWNATDAGNGGAFACAVIEVDAAVTTAGQPVVSPLNGHTYHLLSPATWSVAQARAREMGGHLATIRSLDENRWLEWFLGSLNVTNGAWIGLTDQGAPGVFRWVSGEVYNYALWKSGEPGGENGIQSYVALGPGSGWMDQQEGWLLPAIVEVVPDATPILRDDEYLSGNDAAGPPPPLHVATPGVLANDTSPSGQPMTAVLLTEPQHGLGYLDPSGFFQYVPAAGFVGTDSFTYSARAGMKSGPAATVTLNVRRLITVDTVNLTITGDGDSHPGALNGTPFRAERTAGAAGAPGEAVFRFLGDLHIGADQGLAVVGPDAVRLLAGNDAVIEAGAILDVSARPNAAGPGGGVGGHEAAGAAGGRLGAMSSGYPGGVGGSGGSPGTCLFTNGGRGKAGDPGHVGDSGSPGHSGQPGGANAGKDGFLSPGGGGVPGTGGTGGSGGPGGSGGGRGGGGGGGAGGYTSGSTGTAGNPGYEGTPGTPGSSGGRGGDGVGGENLGVGPALSGGSGGGSGGSGGGGGAGGDGGAGGSGGGGGGGGTSCWSGGHGGQGGAGGRGGYGGEGGMGGVGAAGGPGGGALEIAAFGRLILSGRVIARGGPGISVCVGQAIGLNGSVGDPPGVPADGVLWHDSRGGGGGSGKKGGVGGSGGPGAFGGRGAGGAGGGVKLLAAILETPGAIVDATGGLGGAPGQNDGGRGRLIVASNGGGFTATAIGANLERFSGARRPNPFLVPVVTTPTIPDLRGGAEAYGILSGITSADLADIVAGAPAGARAALARMRTGPAPLYDAVGGYDVLLFVNLRNDALAGPALGVGGPPRPLLQGGWMRDPAFGGGAPSAIDALGPREVYALYIPHEAREFRASYHDGGVLVSAAAPMLLNSQTLYLPVTTTLTLLDAARALALATGWGETSAADLARLNTVTTGASAGVVDLADAARIARKVAGLEPNP